MLISNLQVILRYVNSENTVRKSTKRTLQINTQIIQSVNLPVKAVDV